MSSTKTLNLLAPRLEQSSDNLIAKITFQRAFREGGPRIESESVQGKSIYHNYGHGGASWPHAYGAAYLAAKSITIELGNSRSLECAVLGAGFSGLMTALQLAKRSYNVTVYAQRIPELGSKKDNLIASEVDPGKWFPNLCDQGSNPLRHEVLSKLSYDYYKDCIDTKKYQSITTISCYDNHRNLDSLKQVAPAFIVGDYRPVKVTLGARTQDYIEFNSLTVDAAFFLQQLIVEAKLRGVKFVQQKFNSLNDILALKETTIMNCLGLGGARLFNDQKVKPITGFFLVFKNPMKCNYLLSTKYQGQELSYYGVKDKFVVGYYTTNPRPKQEEFESILSKARLHLFQPSAKL